LLRRAGGDLLLRLLQAARRGMQLKGRTTTKSGALIQTKQRSETFLQPTSTTNRAVTPASFTYRRGAVFLFNFFMSRQISSNSFLENMISTLYKGFFMQKKETQIRQISKKKRNNPNLQNFKDKFQ
jgi:uncharacterized cupredoxin-like copper-binding protein